MISWQINTIGRRAAVDRPDRPERAVALAVRPRGRRPRAASARALLRRSHITAEDGMSTAEYAIGTIAAAALAAVLYAVVTGDSIVAGLTSLVQRALTVSF